MSRIEKLMAKYEEVKKAKDEFSAAKARANKNSKIVEDCKARIGQLQTEISALEHQAAKEVYEKMDMSRISIETKNRTISVYHPYRDDLTRNATITQANFSCLGLNFKIGGFEIGDGFDWPGVEFDEYIARKSVDVGACKHFLDSLDVDIEGGKRALNKTIQAKVKEAKSLPEEIKLHEGHIDERLATIASLEEMAAEEVPDNIITRKLFKKKFEERDAIPGKIKKLKEEIAELRSKIEDAKRKIQSVSGLQTEEQISQFIDSEIEVMRSFVSRDWTKEVSAAGSEQKAELRSLEERKEEAFNNSSSYNESSRLTSVSNEYHRALRNLEKDFSSEKFMAEFKAIDEKSLTPEQREVYLDIKEAFNKYMENKIQSYGSGKL